CLTGVKPVNEPVGVNPVSSVNSRFAQSSRSSSGFTSPFGTDHAPSSLFLKKGPPGWTNSTCTCASRTRYITKPALTEGMASDFLLICVATQAAKYEQILRSLITQVFTSWND